MNGLMHYFINQGWFDDVLLFFGDDWFQDFIFYLKIICLQGFFDWHGDCYVSVSQGNRYFISALVKQPITR